jgi:hypothetical protein
MDKIDKWYKMSEKEAIETYTPEIDGLPEYIKDYLKKNSEDIPNRISRQIEREVNELIDSGDMNTIFTELFELKKELWLSKNR